MTNNNNDIITAITAVTTIIIMMIIMIIITMITTIMYIHMSMIQPLAGIHGTIVSTCAIYWETCAIGPWEWR